MRLLSIYSRCARNANVLRVPQARMLDREQRQDTSLLRGPEAAACEEAMRDSEKWRLCAEWLRFCLSIGWAKSDLDALERVFWQCDGWKTFRGYP